MDRKQRFWMQGLSVLLWIAGGTPGQTADWDQWRGPNRNGKASGFQAPATWPKTPTHRWKVEVGLGHASPLLVGNRVYLFARRGENEVVQCLDGANGQKVWSHAYPAPYQMDSAARGHGPGPKSTPLYHEGRLYTFGISGILTCTNTQTGRVVWREDFKKQYKATSPQFGVAMSPLLADGLLIVHAGGPEKGALTAFDAKTGRVRWRWDEDGPAYASPILADFGGVRQIVTQTQRRCVGVSLADGKLLWSLPFTTPYEQNAVTPMVMGYRVLFGGLQQPTFACQVTRNGANWQVSKGWETRDVSLYMSSPILSNRQIYGMSERSRGQMFILDAVSGKTVWKDGGRLGENAALVDIGDSLLALINTGELRVYKKMGNSLTLTARYQVASSPTWATPAVSGKRVLIKDETHLTLWEF